MIRSDWHIHTKNSYDATLSLEEIANNAQKYGFSKIGITDHANFNDGKFLGDLNNSIAYVKDFQKTHPHIVMGVELTPIEKPEFDHIEKTGTRDGYVPPQSDKPYEIELARTKQQLIELGVRYAIGGAHWRVDVAHGRELAPDIDAMIKEWYRQQMWLACDERVTILGHPWYNGSALWYDDFSVIPHSMNMDIGAALKENGKYAECNAGVLCSDRASEKFRRQYCEFLRELFEMGIPITYGSDSHKVYADKHLEAEKYLKLAGFCDGDISEIDEVHLWQI